MIVGGKDILQWSHDLSVMETCLTLFYGFDFWITSMEP